MRIDLHERLNRAVDFGILSKNGTIYKSRVNFFKQVPKTIKSMLQSERPTEFDFYS